MHFWETYAKLGNKVSRIIDISPGLILKMVRNIPKLAKQFAVPMTWNISDKDLIHAFADMGPRSFPTSVIRVVTI